MLVAEYGVFHCPLLFYPSSAAYSNQLSSFAKAIADACKVSATFNSELHESEVPSECEQQFDEDQELQQIIDGKICMKIYHFSSGTVN